MKIQKTHYFYLCLVLLICIPVILPYFHAGYFPTHDGEWAVVRLSDMYRTLRDLQFPARYSDYLNFSYGYPLFNFTYPLPYYLGFVIHLFKFDFVTTIKILFASSVFVSAGGMYLFSSTFWKNKNAGFISSLLYIYLPYRFVDLYVRGSIGESLSFAIFPFLLFFLLKISQTTSLFPVLLSSLLYAALVLTHNIMVVEFTPVVLLISIVLTRIHKKSMRRYIAFFVLSMLLSAFFWLPALMEKNTIALSVVPIADRSLYFVSFNQLLFSPWGYGTPTDKTPFTYQIGIPHIVVFVVVIITLVVCIRKQNIKHDVTVLLSALLSILVVFYLFLLFSPSGVFWNTMPFFKEINYPWTLLACIGLCISVICGIVAKIPYGAFFGFGLVVIAVLLYLSDAKPQYYVNRGEGFYSTNQATTTSSDELMPLWVRQKPMQQWTDKVTVKDGMFSNLVDTSKKITFTAHASHQTSATISTIYYPGWTGMVNNKPVQISYNNPKGLITIPLGKGDNMVRLTFGETPIRIFADFLSTLGVVLAIGFVFLNMRKTVLL